MSPMQEMVKYSGSGSGVGSGVAVGEASGARVSTVSPLPPSSAASGTMVRAKSSRALDIKTRVRHSRARMMTCRTLFISLVLVLRRSCGSGRSICKYKLYLSPE